MPPLASSLLRLVVAGAVVLLLLALASFGRLPFTTDLGALGVVQVQGCECVAPTAMDAEWPWRAAANSSQLSLPPEEVQRKLGYSNNGRIAVVYIGNKPALETVEFAADIAGNCLFDVYVVADDNSYVSPSLDLMRPLRDLPQPLPQVPCSPGKPRPVALLQYDDETVIAHNFTGMNRFINEKKAKALKKPLAVGSWEKAVYALFNEPVLNQYAYYVLIEEDTFVPSVRALEKLVSKQIAFDVDFAAPILKPWEAKWPFWTDFERANMPKPWFQGMVNFVCFSDRYLHKLRLFHQYWGHLFFLESMFNTIAETSVDLVVNRPVELVTVQYHAKERFSGDDMIKYIDNIYHPVRAPTLRKGIRDFLKKKKYV